MPCSQSSHFCFAKNGKTRDKLEHIARIGLHFLLHKMDKKEIRLLIKNLISQNQDTLAEKSVSICNKIISSPQFQNSKEIFAYMALPDEVDLTPVILDALEKGKNVALPKIISQSENIIKFFYLDKSKKLTEQTATGTYNILEPDESLPATPDPAQKTLILVPGRAFTKGGDRLGRGKGYYDVIASAAKQSISQIPVVITFATS